LRRFLTMIVSCCTLLLAFGLTMAVAELRREVAAGNLVIVNAWMPQPLKGAKSGVIYLKIENRGTEADQLVAAESPAARQLTLHESKESGSVMKMMSVKAVDIPAHGDIELRPLGMHLMAMGLEISLRPAESFPLILKFKRAGTVSVDVVVQAPNALKPTR
jgi:periplasmic copper chaperone A